MKTLIQKIARSFRLMHLLDKVKFRVQKIRNLNLNKKFQSENPEIVIPPDYLMFESYRLDYKKYYYGGRDSARDVIQALEKHIIFKDKKILDWGCGPARVVRHLPNLLDSSNKFYGTDYNKTSIDWCRKNIKTVHFESNELNPPLNFESNFFDVVYSISIFTHLSNQSHINWINEINRVLKPGALFYTTTHGEIFKSIMSTDEKRIFKNNELVVRGNVIEGHRVFTAFQPPNYFKKLIEGKFQVLEFVPGKMESWGQNQDMWILQKLNPISQT